MAKGNSKLGGSGEFSNYPANFDIKGLKELKDFEGTRGQLYDLIAKNNPTAIIDKRTAEVYIGENRYARENSHYIMIMQKTPSKKMRLRVMWKLGKDGGQYFIQNNEYRRNTT